VFDFKTDKKLYTNDFVVTEETIKGNCPAGSTEELQHSIFIPDDLFCELEDM